MGSLSFRFGARAADRSSLGSAVFNESLPLAVITMSERFAMRKILRLPHWSFESLGASRI